MPRILVLILSSVLLISCNSIVRYFSNDYIAEMNGYVLYESDIHDLVRNVQSPEDSAKIVRKYINLWATNIAQLKTAEAKLSKEAKDVSKELEEYRSSLLVYRYEKMYIEQRLDTVVTARESEEYYKNNINSLITRNSLVKARYIKISTDSPNLSRVNSLFASLEYEDLPKLEELVYHSAEVYSDFDNNWVAMEVIAKELMMDISLCEDIINSEKVIKKERDGYLSMVFVYDRILPMQEMPYEFCKNNIDNIIISKRKQELIKELELALLQEAINNNELTIR